MGSGVSVQIAPIGETQDDEGVIDFGPRHMEDENAGFAPCPCGPGDAAQPIPHPRGETAAFDLIRKQRVFHVGSVSFTRDGDALASQLGGDPTFDGLPSSVAHEIARVSKRDNTRGYVS